MPCLVFVAPILLAYELGVLWLGGDSADALRTGADAWMRHGLVALSLTTSLQKLDKVESNAGDPAEATAFNSPDFKLTVFHGTLAPGSHAPGHYYVEKEGYIPSLELQKMPTDRYKSQNSED